MNSNISRVLVVLLAVALPWLASGTANDGAPHGGKPIFEGIYKFRNAGEAHAVARALSDFMDTKDVKITVDEGKTSVVILAPKELHQTVKEVLSGLERGPALSEKEIAKMNDARLRTCIFALSKHVQELEERVRQLEINSTSLRELPVADRDK